MNPLKENLAALIKEKGWSIARLARMSEIPRSTLNEWLAGRKAVNLEALRKVSHVLGVSVHHLAFGEPDPHGVARESRTNGCFELNGRVRVIIEKLGEDGE